MSGWELYESDKYNSEGDLVVGLYHGSYTPVILRWCFINRLAQYGWLDFYDWLRDPEESEFDPIEPAYIMSVEPPTNTWKGTWE